MSYRQRAEEQLSDFVARKKLGKQRDAELFMKRICEESDSSVTMLGRSILTVIGIIILATFIFVITSCNPKQAHADEINLEIIKLIESSGKERAYNPEDGGRGHFQITPICLEEFNDYHNKKHSPDDLWNPEINKKIASWYLNKRIPQMLKYFGIKDSIENRIISFNAGISTLVYKKPIPKKTKKYITKYFSMGGV